MNVQTMILTCQERDAVREGTLARLAATDWGEIPQIWFDPVHTTDYGARVINNTQTALTWFVSQEDGADFVLLLEDDIAFNAHLRWNLQRWSPVVDKTLDFGSLYNPNIRSLSQGEDYFVADPEACYGAQALLISRPAVGCLLRAWDSMIGLPDTKMPRILARAGYKLFYHQPSLVQHIGAPSVWGGVEHFAVDYSADWKSVPESFHRFIPG